MRLWASVIVQATCADALAYGIENMHRDYIMASGSVLYDVAFISFVAQGHRVYIKLS